MTPPPSLWVRGFCPFGNTESLRMIDPKRPSPKWWQTQHRLRFDIPFGLGPFRVTILEHGTTASSRVSNIITLALPYQAHRPKPWIAFMEEFFGAGNYFVHFNRQPGVTDAVLDQNTVVPARFVSQECPGATARYDDAQSCANQSPLGRASTKR